MTLMDSLMYSGDATKWQVEATKAISEVIESKCTIHDFILGCIKKSIHERSKIVSAELTKVMLDTPDTSTMNMTGIG